MNYTLQMGGAPKKVVRRPGIPAMEVGSTY